MVSAGRGDMFSKMKILSSRRKSVSSKISYILETLEWIEEEWFSFCLFSDKYLSKLSNILEPLKQIETECCSLRIFSDKHQSEISHYLGRLREIEEEYDSFSIFAEEQVLEEPYLFQLLQQMKQECSSFRRVLDEYLFSQRFHPTDTLQRIEEEWSSSGMLSHKYLSKLSHILQSLKQTEEAWSSLCMFLENIDDILCLEDSNFLTTLHRIEENWGSFRIFSDKYLSNVSHLLETVHRNEKKLVSFRRFERKYHFSKESHPLKTLRLIEEEWGSFRLFSEEYLSSGDRFKFLKRDFKFLDIILNLQIFTNECGIPDITHKVQALFQDAEVTFRKLYYEQVRPYSRNFHIILSGVQENIRSCKVEIKKAKYSIFLSLQLSAKMYDPAIAMELFDTVVQNISRLNDPSSLLFVPGPMYQFEKVLKELRIFRSFVCFVSDRCIAPQRQRTFFTYVLGVAWHTAMIAWLCIPSHGNRYLDSSADEMNSLFPDLIQRRIQPIESRIRKIYIDILQALKLVQSRWYPVIQTKYVVDCAVGFLETLLHNLEELPISCNFKGKKATLKEMLNLLRTNLINLPIQALEFHLQDMDSVIVDAGLLVFSLTVVGETNQALGLDFSGKIQSMQAVIYLITRRSFLLQSNLSRIDGLDATDFILDNLKELLSFYSNSIDAVKSQLPTIQNELKCFQAVVEKQDELQHFAAQVIGLAYEVKHISDACEEKTIHDWCLFLWILHIEEDIRLLMAEVAEIQESNVSDLVLPNTRDAPGAHTSSQFARNPDMNQEMVGLMDVMDELRGKLIEGSSNLDVISIVGMPGVGKTTLANKLYFDQSVVSHFDIRAQCCVSQEYTRKDVLIAILGDIIGETAKLDEEVDDVLANKLRKHLFFTRYLIFIDDIWETSAWDDLNLCFHDANNGSRIILTTRHYSVASHVIHVSDPHVLRLLSSDESWTLLQNKVFNEESCPFVLRDVGKSIAQKCGGLPLSIVLVAGILARMEREKHCWEQVATNLGPHIQAHSQHTIDLSYQNLPHHLRNCFLYFGVFLEDKEIQVSKLTCLWISEGFVKAHMEKLPEDIAKVYLENLIERNLVMVAKKGSDGQIKACRIHDLLLEFCREKAKLENFSERITWDRGADPYHVFPLKHKIPRRLSLYSRCSNLAKWCLSFSHVKSFHFREARKIAFSSIDHASYTFKRFKFLRVLDIEFTIIDSFPQELTLLRYLAFRTAKDAISLPANLWNLETLIVQGIRGRVSLPDTIWKMVKLRHLHIYDQALFNLGHGQEFLECPLKMDDLLTLSSVCFSSMHNAEKILEKTPNLRKLRCEVSKYDSSPAFSNLTELVILKISSSPAMAMINELKFPSNLKKLTLSNFRIHLNEVATHPKLEVLKLQGITIISNVWKVSNGQFFQLKFLKLENSSFSEWDVSDDAFPCLEHLVLKRCRYLKMIPSCFGYMPSLKFIEVKSCKESVAELAMVIKEMQVEEMGYSGFEVFIHK